MLQIHIVNEGNKQFYQSELDQSHALRHRIYIEELKWRGLTPRADKREFDQFDTSATTYLLAIENGVVWAGTRLNPTIDACLLRDVFAHLVNRDFSIPADPRIFEWTRFYVAPEKREEHKASKVGSLLLSSVIDFLLSEEINSITTVLNVFWLSRFLNYGWNVVPLGLPTVHDGEWLLAVRIAVTSEALAGLRDWCELPTTTALTFKGQPLSLMTAVERLKVA